MRLLKRIFGGGRNVIVETAGAFIPNAEASAQREADLNSAALAQYAAEFAPRPRRTVFDSLVDGLNRLVRPLLTFTILVPIPAAMFWPERTASAVASLGLLPAGYWAVVGVVISFFFGGRMQIKAQDFARSVTSAVARAPQVIQTMAQLRKLTATSPGVAATGSDQKLTSSALDPDGNAALDQWRQTQPQGGAS